MTGTNQNQRAFQVVKGDIALDEQLLTTMCDDYNVSFTLGQGRMFVTAYERVGADIQTTLDTVERALRQRGYIQ